MAAIARFGTRVVPDLQQIIQSCRAQQQLVQGPHIEAFEAEFQQFLGAGHVKSCSTEYGRMALYFILTSMDFPAGAEIVAPALTFWVVPEVCRVAGLTVVFADIDPATFTLDPRAVERAITPRTVAILPTHLYGLACDMDPILDIARRHNLKVIEDCAHSLGAEYKGRMVGTLGDASFFSFQAFKPLNTYGGGLAWMRDAELARRVGALADDEQWPTEKRVESILRQGKWQHTFIRPKIFTYSLFPILVCRVVHRIEARGAAVGKRASIESAARALSRTVHQRAGGDRARRVAAAARVHRADAPTCAHSRRHPR
ncbi:MAG: aminotransferase class I/II-fold pyridoxal phosphate-dependent enzyme [Vicinamibacterales bacterium]